MTVPFQTVLVANRGEIAVRIIATLRALGIRPVAVYSDADDGAPHVLQADVAVRLGPARANESYLNVAAIIAAARSTGAEAIHPGYGFLSESPALARACADAGITFIGPSVAALAAMGDKIRAKELATAAGVPVIDGVAEAAAEAPPAAAPAREEPSQGEGEGDGHQHGEPHADHDLDLDVDLDERDQALVRAATELGFPVLVKPSAGGGGKGMVRAAEAAALPEAIASARRVAAAAFADDSLLVERLLPAPRHVEVQVLADVHGCVLALGERDCSLQRRHQKVIEEAPATLLDGPTRTRLAEAACAVAAAVDYCGAGTVEFLVSAEDPQRFAFLEMNTRLQVEHPVTEEVLGVDLVSWQVRIAAGERLDFDPAALHPAGHAVEARIYAERPDAGFLPATGTVQQVRWPAGVRVDAGVATGSVVSSHYDPMLAKLIATGADRAEALHRLETALAQTVLLGVDTNLGYLRRVLSADAVRAGTADTTFLDTFDGADAADDPAAVEMAVIAAGLVCHAARWPGSLWEQPSGWRIGAPEPPVYRFETATGPVGVALSGPPEAATAQVLPGAPTSTEYPLRQVSLTGRPDSAVEQLLRIDGTTVTTHAVRTEDAVWLHTRAGIHRLVIARPAATTARITGADAQVRSPMPGTVVAVHVPESDMVAPEELLVTVEAMKMEYQVRAGSAGRIHLEASVGDQVAAEQVLAHIHPDDPQDQPG